MVCQFERILTSYKQHNRQSKPTLMKLEEGKGILRYMAKPIGCLSNHNITVRQRGRKRSMLG